MLIRLRCIGAILLFSCMGSLQAQQLAQQLAEPAVPDDSACRTSLGLQPFDPNACETLLNNASPAQQSQVHAWLATGYARSNRATEADGYIGLAQTTATSWQTLNDLGVARLYQGRFRDARDLLIQASNADPRQPAPRLNLALALRGVGEFGAASAEYEAYLNLKAEQQAARFYPGANSSLCISQPGVTECSDAAGDLPRPVQ